MGEIICLQMNLFLKGDVLRTVYVLLTMDCETAKSDVTPYATQMSGSGPQDYEESERSIRGFVETAASFGYPTTLLAHPEVAVGNKELLLELEEKGACLGLHLHPYKLKEQNYSKSPRTEALGNPKMVSESMSIALSKYLECKLFFIF